MTAADVHSCCLILVTSETLSLNPRTEQVTRATSKLPANRLLSRSLLKETDRNLCAGNSSLLYFGKLPSFTSKQNSEFTY